MKNKIVLIYSAVLALSPSVVLADLDPTTLIQDKINVYQEEINKVTKETSPKKTSQTCLF